MSEHTQERGNFKSNLGFIIAASGAAIGVGNIWQFPTQVAENGGAAFVFVYLILTFLLGYPVLMAELVIGRYTRTNLVGAYKKLGKGRFTLPAYWSICCMMIVLGFYSIISGRLLAQVFVPIFSSIGLDSFSIWINKHSVLCDVLFAALFYFVTILIVKQGIRDGIEKWATRLMPILLLSLLLLAIYVSTLSGATTGLKKYLIPDFSNIFDPTLIIKAMGQGFFSLSVGIGSILIYGSYMSEKANIVKTGALITLSDLGVAFLAGLLIIPAMFVASENGIQIFDSNGHLLASKAMVFKVLPELFNTMGSVGIFVAIVFFILMTIAALTSSIALLEGLVAFGVDNQKLTRKKSTTRYSVLSFLLSLIIIVFFDTLFGLAITIVNDYSLPLLAAIFCIFVGWVINRNSLLEEIRKGYPNAENSLFFKFWPFFIKLICPILILAIFIHQIV